MTDNYTKIVQKNINRLYDNLPEDLAQNLLADQDGKRFVFNAFGEKCSVTPAGITLGKKDGASVLGILISLYALYAKSDHCILTPFRAFKEFSDSMPYAGAFASHTEQVLVPHVPKINASVEKIQKALDGREGPVQVNGDFSFVVYPLPKIALCYIFYESDEDFPAAVTCLYSNNADRFMPIDGLADVGEYTSRRILDLVGCPGF